MKKMKTDFISEFKTPLGVVNCGVISNNTLSYIETKKYKNSSSEILKTEVHKIEIVSFKIIVPLYDGDILTDSLGWIYRIEKIVDVYELLETYCLLDKVNEDVSFELAAGENLDAIQAEYNEWILHIGTEDGEILHSRAENDDLFPQRLKDKVDSFNSITKIMQNGFMTKIPDLKKGEKIHIQYLAAYDKNDLQKVNTWLAVDELKIKLEKWTGIL